MESSAPVVWIGLDALDLDEVRRRIGDGRMPHLARIAAAGPLQTLGPDVPGFAGAIWRSFVNGCSVDGHGWHFGKVWRPEIGSLDAASPDFLRLRPFWSELSRAGMRLGLIDVPYAPDPGEGFNGVFLSGWQTHDSHKLTARPSRLVAGLTGRFGKPLLPDEIYGPPRPAGLLRLHDAAIRSIRQIADIGSHLLKSDRFDLFMLVIGASHRAGHYLWDLSQIDPDKLSAADSSQLQAAMDDVYAACDAAVGRISAAPARRWRASASSRCTAWAPIRAGPTSSPKFSARWRGDPGMRPGRGQGCATACMAGAARRRRCRPYAWSRPERNGCCAASGRHACMTGRRPASSPCRARMAGRCASTSPGASRPGSSSPVPMPACATS